MIYIHEYRAECQAYEADYNDKNFTIAELKEIAAAWNEEDHTDRYVLWDSEENEEVGA